MRNPSSKLLKWVCALVLVLSPLAAGQNQPKFQILAQIPIASANTSNFVTLNGALNLIYVSGGFTLDSQAQQTIFAIDGSTFSVTASGLAGSGAAVDIKTDNYWAGNVCLPNCGSVLIYNSSNQSQPPITTAVSPFCPGEVVLDGKLRRMWVGAQCGGGINGDPVFAFNADNSMLIAGPIYIKGVMGGLSVNPNTGRLYVQASGTPKRVDPKTFAVTTTAFGTVLAVNPVRNLLYAVSGGSNLQIVNGAPDPETILHTVALGYTPSFIDDNDALGHLYISNPTTNSIEIRNDQTGQPILDQSHNPITFPLGSGNVPGSIAADSLRGRLSVVVTNGSTVSLYVIEDLSTVRTCGSPGGSCSIGTGPK